jgi:hypothetical protein
MFKAMAIDSPESSQPVTIIEAISGFLSAERRMIQPPINDALRRRRPGDAYLHAKTVPNPGIEAYQ